MSRSKAFLASSLAICTSAWALGDYVSAEDNPRRMEPRWDEEKSTQEILFQYLNPITVISDGRLSKKNEVKLYSYRVKKGDNLSSISNFFGVEVSKIVKKNQIEDPHLLNIGQELTLPILCKKIPYANEEDFESFAKKHQVPVELLTLLNPILKEEKANHVEKALFVPVHAPLKSPPSAPPVKKKKKTYKNIGKTRSFQWPVNGSITSNFGWRHGHHHKGLDIWNVSRGSTEISSSLGGTVVRAGYSPSYGNLVVIQHPGGWETYYAHLSRMLVSKGQVVNVGQTIGIMGRTGHATGYHLHFEIRKNGRALNPLVLLGR